MLSDNNQQILKIALPSIISNITVPLLGLIDVTIVGHLGSASYIGAIAIGGMIFNIIYWIFGFLRMGTGGLTSQALGKHDNTEVSQLLTRSLGVGAVISLCLLILQYPIQQTAFYFLNTSQEIETLATQYFKICIWGAPAVLCLYGYTGWFIGMQNSRIPMFIAITQNIVNIIFSLFFVYGLNLKIEGIALGTLLSQYSGIILAYILYNKHYKSYKNTTKTTSAFKKGDMLSFFRVNKDIFLRTVCLVAVTVFFTSSGAAQGDNILAVNTLLLQFFTIYSYIMDGFAHAGEAITGKYYGANDIKRLKKTVFNLFKWGTSLALLFTLIYLVFGSAFIRLLTNNSEIITLAKDYYYWVVAIPLVGFTAFLLDGIFIGITATKLMLKAMFFASLAFFGIFYSLSPILSNHALWLAFISYLLLRGLIQAFLGKKLLS